MTIKEFGEMAIDGGFKLTNKHLTDGVWYNFPAIFLDPEAWKAVGKVKGWTLNNYHITIPYAVSLEEKERMPYINFQGPRWQAEMMGMTYSLTQGKTLEEYIAIL